MEGNLLDLVPFAVHGSGFHTFGFDGTVLGIGQFLVSLQMLKNHFSSIVIGSEIFRFTFCTVG